MKDCNLSEDYIQSNLYCKSQYSKYVEMLDERFSLLMKNQLDTLKNMKWHLCVTIFRKKEMVWSCIMLVCEAMNTLSMQK